MTYLEANALDILFKTLLESENAGELPDEILDKIDANREELDLDVEDIETTKQVFISQLGHVITRPNGKKDIILSNKEEKEAFLEALGAFMQEEVNSPYYSLKSLIDNNDGEDCIHIVDFHAEATGEKISFAYCFDGLVSAIVGTHTHVQTNDAKILEGGTGFITDVGMCGGANGVLGFDRNTVIQKTVFGSTERFDIDKNDQEMVNAVVIDVDDMTHKTREIFAVTLLGEKHNG